jgi:hypothetical protein
MVATLVVRLPKERAANELSPLALSLINVML